MAKDDLEEFWAAVRPKKTRKKPLYKLPPDAIVRGQAWVGLFGPDGKELSFEGYERQPVSIPAMDPITRQMVFNFSFPMGTVKGVIDSIGLWETKTGDMLIHRSLTFQTVHITEQDTLNLNLTITDSPHPYGGLANMLKMRGLL